MLSDRTRNPGPERAPVFANDIPLPPDDPTLAALTDITRVTGGYYNADTSFKQGEGPDLLNGQGGPTDFDGDLSQQNTILNGGAEVDATHWTGDGNTTVSSSTTAATFRSGIASFKHVATGAGGVGMATATADRYPVTAGYVYTASAWSNPAATSRSCRISLDWYSAAGALLSSTDGTLVANSAGTWTLVLVSGTAPANAATVGVRVSTTASAAAEITYWDDITFWSRTVWTNLGWVLSNCTPYLLSLKGATSMMLVSNAGVGQFCGVTSPLLAYDATRTYEAFMPLTYSYLSTNPGEAGVAAVEYLNTNGVVFPDGNIITGPLGSGYGFVDMGTRWGSYQSGGLGYPNAPNVLHAQPIGVGSGWSSNTVPNISNVRAKLGVLSQGAGDQFIISGFSLSKQGELTGHLTPLGAVARLRVGTAALADHTTAAGSVWETYDTVTIPQPSTGMVSLAITLLCQGNWGASGTTGLNVRVSVSFNGGVTYGPVSPQTPGLSFVAGLSAVLGTQHVATGTPSAPIKIKVETFQTAGGVVASFSAGVLNWTMVPA